MLTKNPILAKTVAVSPGDVDTIASSWVVGKILAEPAINDMQNLAAVSIFFAPGKGHERHSHPGSEQLIFVHAGEAEMMIEFEEGQPEYRTIRRGDLVSIPRGAYHSTINRGWEPVHILAIYSPPGPEEAMRSSSEFTTFAAGEVPRLTGEE